MFYFLSSQRGKENEHCKQQVYLRWTSCTWCCQGILEVCSLFTWKHSARLAVLVKFPSFFVNSRLLEKYFPVNDYSVIALLSFSTAFTQRFLGLADFFSIFFANTSVPLCVVQKILAHLDWSRGKAITIRENLNSSRNLLWFDFIFWTHIEKHF